MFDINLQKSWGFVSCTALYMLVSGLNHDMPSETDRLHKSK